MKTLGSVSTTSNSSFLFRRTKSTASRIQFSARYEAELKKISLLSTWLSHWRSQREAKGAMAP